MSNDYVAFFINHETKIMARNNETWLVHLNSEGSDRQVALSDLRKALLGSLHVASRKWTLADDAFLDDAVQDSLIRILERLPQFEGRSQFLTWATSIAIRVALNELRHRRWKDVSLDEVIADTDLTLERANDDGYGPGVQHEQKTIIDKMYDVIQNDLTEKQRKVLFSRLENMPCSEIARHLGCNLSAVNKMLHDARKRLRYGLEAAGYKVTDIQAIFAS